MKKLKISDIFFVSVILAFDICVSAFNIISVSGVTTGNFAVTIAYLIFMCAAIFVSYILKKKNVLLFSAFFFAVGAFIDALTLIPKLGGGFFSVLSAIFLAPYMGIADVLSLENVSRLSAILFNIVFSVLSLAFLRVLPPREQK